MKFTLIKALARTAGKMANCCAWHSKILEDAVYAKAGKRPRCVEYIEQAIGCYGYVSVGPERDAYIKR